MVGLDRVLAQQMSQDCAVGIVCGKLTLSCMPCASHCIAANKSAAPHSWPSANSALGSFASF
jgi:hypothetical protein